MLVRSINSIASVGAKLGFQNNRLDGDDVIDRLVHTHARNTSQAPGLQLLRGAISSAEEGHGLSAFGRLSVQSIARRTVNNSLWLEGLSQHRTTLFDEPVREPVFIVGWYRSGTTYLHRLLAEATDMSTPNAYDLYFPRAGIMPSWADKQWRVTKMAGMLQLARLAVPELDGLHTIRARSAEESTVLLDNSGVGVYFLHAFGAHSHGEYIRTTDLGFAYQAMRQQMQILQQRNKTHARWLMKCPFSLGRLDTLLEAFPDAHIVYIHRPPVQSLHSVCNLAAVLQRGFRNEVAMHDIGRFWFDFYRDEISRARLIMDGAAATRIIDVSYDELMRTPNETIQSIACRIGVKIKEGYRASPDMRRHPRSRYQYALPDFGLSRIGIETEFRQTRPSMW